MANQPEGIWIIDSQARTLYANAAMAEILGAQPDELMGQHSFDYIYPEDAADAARLFESKQKGDPAPFHFKLKRRDGSPIWVDVQGSPMSDADGVFIGIVGTFSVSANQAP